MYYQGNSALSSFRREKLLKAAQLEVPVIKDISAQYLYFVDTTRSLSNSEKTQLQAILPDGVEGQRDLTNQHYLLVIPRAGTISPWSSKATEIINICGLSAVKRLERAVLWTITANQQFNTVQLAKISPLLHDRMTETVLFDIEKADALLFPSHVHAIKARPLLTINILEKGKAALVQANREMGLALSEDEIEYLVNNFIALQRNPTDVELMMFAQANSEHCRHKIFNADWIIDGQAQDLSLFQMIRHTYQQHPGQVISAYHDNAAVMQGFPIKRFGIGEQGAEYGYVEEDTAILMKVETHNHPTAISPFCRCSDRIRW